MRDSVFLLPCSPDFYNMTFYYLYNKKVSSCLTKSFLCRGYRIAALCLVSLQDTLLQALLSPFGKGKTSPCLSVFFSKCQSYFIGLLRQSPLPSENISCLLSPSRKYQAVPKNHRKSSVTSEQDTEGGGTNSKWTTLREPLKGWTRWYLPWRPQPSPSWLWLKPSCISTLQAWISSLINPKHCFCLFVFLVQLSHFIYLFILKIFLFFYFFNIFIGV